MKHASSARLIVLLTPIMLLAAPAARAIDLNGLDDVTMRVIEPGEKATVIAPQRIELPVPNALTPQSRLTNANPIPAKPAILPGNANTTTAVGVMKTK